MVDTWLERALAFIAPRYAAKRAYALHVLDNFRTYEAAGKGRRWKGIKPTSNDAERENASALTTTRNRARYLVRNNWIAGRGVDTIIANTIGHGIELSTKSKKILNLWNSWARTNAISFDGDMDFFALQGLAMGTIVESGEVLVKKVRDPESDIPLKIQLLEGDYIDTSKNSVGAAEGGQIRNGIEFDATGKVVAYWLFDQHPGASLLSLSGARFSSTRHSTDDVRLVFRKTRIGQVRGITWFAKVMLKMRDLDDYDDAQLYRQKIAACFAGFVETPDGLVNTPTTAEGSDPITSKLEPGAMEVLPPGKKITFATPPGVGADYDPFTKRQIMSIAAGIGVTYEAMSNDYSNVNFSSARMGWLEMWRNIEMWRWGMFIPMFCETVWEWFVEACVIKGLIDSSRVKDYQWTPPRREMIDPVKETAALKDQVRSGFASYSEAIRGMGKDPEQHMAEMAADFSALDKLKLTIESDPRFNLKNNSSNTEGGSGEAKTVAAE